MAQFLAKTELDAQSVQFEGNKFGVKLDPNGHITKSDAGIAVELPDAVIAVSNIAVDTNANALTITTTDGQQTTQQLPALPVDVKLQGAELLDTNRLKLTLTDGTELEVDLSSLIPPAKSAQDLWDEIRALPTFKADLLAVIKGEEVKDFGDNLKGYLLSKDA